MPEGLYPGDYLKPVGEALAADFGDRYVHAPETAWLAIFRARTVAAMMETIRDDLSLLGICHDRFSSEASLVAAGKPDAAEAWLRERDLVYDGVLEPPKGEVPKDWHPIKLPLFRSTSFGDDQDRPIRKPDGSWTYFGVDLAYHFEKARDADELIDIWGADHAGTVKRIVAAADALIEGRKRFDVKLGQIVRQLRAGEPVMMSKRAGTLTLRRWWRHRRTIWSSMFNMPMRAFARLRVARPKWVSGWKPHPISLSWTVRASRS